jgi:predicted RNA-binding Zn-ribbon protein involved in translation (DUF1610 family)
MDEIYGHAMADARRYAAGGFDGLICSRIQAAAVSAKTQSRAIARSSPYGGPMTGGRVVRVRAMGAMWKCPACGRLFANRSQAHACGQWTVADHFRGKPKHLRKLFDRFLTMIRRHGPVRLHPAKTRIDLFPPAERRE